MNATSSADFADMKDEKLCHSTLDNNPYAREARTSRNLGDCSDSYLKCKGYGFAPSDPEFPQCRMLVDNRSSGRSSTPVYVAPQTPAYKPTMTTCRQSYSGAAVHCNSF
ncbi:hypothetical protein OIU34_00050 [Pararhizobium sp. BT-229]|uniref:hypothetical protein n=1 Tax=Pararhizobium sp. BT-229 TaxID=2986923 RepID=UPI0021F7E9D6|nr:hypothetical protein [Pararhizobium sp. BT-229]MCV9960279.1 hypothetical protein [Pararhizobium sp. BT-229]